MFAGALVLAACLWFGAAAPEQVHAAIAGQDSYGNSHGIAFSWATPTSTATSVVFFGLSAGNLSFTASGYGLTYLQVNAWAYMTGFAC